MHVLSRRFDGVQIRRFRSIAPLAALVAIALSAIVLAAQAGLAFCDQRVALPMAAMSPMDDMGAMPSVTIGAHAVMICPVVLVLIVASVLIAAAAIVVIGADRDRAATHRSVARMLVRLPVAPVAGLLVAGAALAVGAMIAVDGNGMPNAITCAELAALVVACALGATALAQWSGAAMLAFGKRLIIALLLAIAQCANARPPRVSRRFAPRTARETIRLLAAGCGLRAPPLFVR